MRFLSLWLCVASLSASEPLRIVAVERQGPPPYEDDRRIYRLQGTARVSAGELLELKRPGTKEHPGRLRVLRTTSDGVLALLDRRGDTFPMKGDVASHWEMTGLPELPIAETVSPTPLPLETGQAIPQDPRHLREALYFRPGDATLSPLGHAKVEAWVREMGEGRWTLEYPKGKGEPTRLTQARLKSLKAALEAAGAKGVQVKAIPPPSGQTREVVHVRYEEGRSGKSVPAREA